MIETIPDTWVDSFIDFMDQLEEAKEIGAITEEEQSDRLWQVLVEFNRIDDETEVVTRCIDVNALKRQPTGEQLL